MKPIVITSLLYLGLLGCQNNNKQASSPIGGNLVEGKSEINVHEAKQIEFLNLPISSAELSKSYINVQGTKQDTIEFVSFWNLFRNAVLKHDIKTLSSMLDDSIIGGDYLTRNFTDSTDKTPQTIILEKFHNLFTADYLLLLQDYDIQKDLYRNCVESEFPKYRYVKIINNKTYNAGITFYKGNENEDDNSIKIDYYMGCDMEKAPLIDKDYGSIYNITFSLKFHKSLNRFRLYKISYMYNLTIAE